MHKEKVTNSRDFFRNSAGAFLVGASLLASCRGSDVSYVPSPTPTPYADTMSPRLEEGPKIEFRKDILPAFITIPSLDIEKLSIQAVDVDSHEHAYSTPDHSLATNSDDPNYLSGKLFVFGHSQWLSEPQIFHRLQDIQKEDKVIIDGIDRKTGQNLGELNFSIDSIYIADENSVNALIFESYTNTPRLFLLTTLRDYNPKINSYNYLLDINRLIPKSTVAFQEGTLDNLVNQHLYLLVTGSLSEEDLKRLRVR